jgi:hypothetical protein
VELPESARELIESGALAHLVTRARLEEGGAPELPQRLAHVHLGPDVKFPAMDDPPPGHVTRTAAERIGGVGPWAPR